jgi:hypothetical protein
MNIEFHDMSAIFVDSPWVVVVVSRAPVVIIAYNTLFIPLVIFDIIDHLVSHIYGTFEPIALKNTTAVFSITTEAALSTIWEDDPTFTLNDQALTGCGQVRQE